MSGVEDFDVKSYLDKEKKPASPPREDEAVRQRSRTSVLVLTGCLLYVG